MFYTIGITKKTKTWTILKKKYPIGELELDAQEDKLIWMKQKVEDLKIEYTPTFFINNQHLPDDFYSYNDFNYLFL